MRKLAIGVLVVAVLAVAGYFGVNAYAQHQAEQEVAAAFEAVRSRGTTANYGAVSFDLWSRTLAVSDIAIAPLGALKGHAKVGRFEARGVERPAAGRISAARIEVSDVESEYELTVPTAMTVAYKIPRAVVDGFSGPAGPLRPFDSTSLVDAGRFLLEHVKATTLTSLSIPTMTAQVEPAPSDRPNPIGPTVYVYTGLTLHDLRDGRLASSTIERMTAKSFLSGPKAVGFSFEASDFAALDFDANAILAMFDPTKAKDGSYHPVYRRLTMGPYTARFDQIGPAANQSMQMTVGGIKVDDVGLKPSKLQIQDILTLVQAMPPTGAPPSPDAAKAILDQMARIYEGVRIGRLDLSGLTMTVVDKSSVSLAAVRLDDFANGKLGEFTLEGFDAEGGAEPVKIGRFTLKSLAVADLLRTTAALGARGDKPTPDQLMALLRLLEGAELQGVVAPYENTGATLTIDTLAASWGRFVGVVPTTARIAAKMTGPVVPQDAGLYQLLAGTGINALTFDLDIGVAWDEKALTVVLAPGSIELGGLFAGSARASLANVSRDVFAVDPATRAMAMGAILAAPVELTINDLGGLDILLQKFASEHNMSLDEARQQAIDQLRAGTAEFAAANPDVPAVIDAAATFIANPHGSLTVRLAPTGPVNLLAQIAASRQDAAAALANVHVTAIAAH